MSSRKLIEGLDAPSHPYKVDFEHKFSSPNKTVKYRVQKDARLLMNIAKDKRESRDYRQIHRDNLPIDLWDFLPPINSDSSSSETIDKLIGYDDNLIEFSSSSSDELPTHENLINFDQEIEDNFNVNQQNSKDRDHVRFVTPPSRYGRYLEVPERDDVPKKHKHESFFDRTPMSSTFKPTREISKTNLIFEFNNWLDSPLHKSGQTEAVEDFDDLLNFSSSSSQNSGSESEFNFDELMKDDGPSPGLEFDQTLLNEFENLL